MRRRELVFNNQFNVALVVFCFIILLIDSTSLWYSSGIESLVFFGPTHSLSFEFFLTLIVAVINLFLNSKGYFKVSRIVVSFVPLFLLIILPLMAKGVLEGFYLWFPYEPIGFILLPILLYNHKEDRILYWLSFFYCFFFIVFSKEILDYYSGYSLDILKSVEKYVLFYRVAPMILALFIFLSVSYLNQQLNTYTYRLKKRNEKLKKTIKELNLTQSQLVSNEKMAVIGR
ncbi:MAG: hypothetical protein OEY56_13225, partial [Cyclobacteriaceae bacterium]|nr:hypothetical protein [Cyclobacteriaceae bacterium]